MPQNAPNDWERLFIFLQTVNKIEGLSVYAILSLSKRFNVEPETFLVLIKLYGYDTGKNKVR